MARMYRVRAASSGWVGGPGLNTFYFVNTADPTVTTSVQAAVCRDRVRAAFAGAVLMYPVGWSMQVSSEIDEIDSATGTLLNTTVAAGTTPVAGTGGGGFGPTAVGLVATFNTAGLVAGRRVKGRAFLSPMCGDRNADGTPNAAHVTRAQAIADTMYLVAGGTISQVVWSRPRLALPGTHHIVSGALVKAKYGVLRSRRD